MEQKWYPPYNFHKCIYHCTQKIHMLGIITTTTIIIVISSLPYLKSSHWSRCQQTRVRDVSCLGDSWNTEVRVQVTKISLLLSENSTDIKQTANQDYINISNKRNSRYNIKTTYQLVTFKFTIKPKCLICSNNESPVCYC